VKTDKQKQILTDLRANDKNAINELYESYSRRLYNFAFSYLKTEEDTLDVIQNVFINLWEKRESIKSDTNLEAYIFTIAKNGIISLFRKKISEKKYLEHLQKTAIVAEDNLDDKYDYDLLNDRIRKLIDELPEQRRRVFLMSKEDGLGNKEIASELNISVKTVEDHKAKAKKFIREKLANSGFITALFLELFI